MEYKIEQQKLDDSSLKELYELMIDTFPKAQNKFSINAIKWEYIDNPVGKVVAFNAYWGKELAAHYATIPILMNIEGRVVKGLLSLNTATRESHRGNGLFTKLAKITYDYAAEIGYEFVIGVANGSSTPGFLNRLNFNIIAPLECKVGIGLNIFNSTEKSYSRYWDEELLNWRLRNPIIKYSYLKNNIFCKAKIIGFKNVMGNFPKELISTFSINKSKFIFRPFNLYIGLGADLRKGLYFSVPKFIKHPPFNLIILDLTGKLPPIKKEDIFFQLIDFDVA